MEREGSITNTARLSKQRYKNAVCTTGLSWTIRGMSGISFPKSSLWGKGSF